MAGEPIFQMYKLSKVYPPDREVLKDISLSFLPGREDRRARLQRLRQVVAAGDHGRARQRVPRRRDARAGRLGRPARAGAPPRRVQGRARPTCSRAWRAPRRARSSASTSLPRTTRTRRPPEFARLQDQIDAADAWNLDGMIEHAMDALRCPPGDAAVGPLSGGERRRVALCRLLLVPARPAAARRADQPPRRRVGRVARAPPRRVQGHRRRGHPRPLLPRQRRRLDPRARPRPRHPLPRQLLRLARAEAGAAGAEREAGDRPPANDRRRARVGAHEPQGPAHEVQGAPRQLRGAARRRRRGQARPGADPHPGRPAARRPRDRGAATCARASATAC